MDADIYNGGRYLRRWALVEGRPRCPDTALYLPETDEETIGAAMARNRAVAAVAATAEAYEAAAALLASPAAEEAPERAVAEALMASAGPSLLHLVRTRADQLGKAEAGYVLAWPDMPAFDPRTETVDLFDGGWAVRSLTAEELASHPLRPAAFMSKMAFAALLIDTLGDTLGMTVLGMYASVLALAADVDFVDVFDNLNGDPAQPGYAAQLLAQGAVTEGQVAALRAGWRRACKA